MKRETRGRHKKSCTCGRCKKKAPIEITAARPTEAQAQAGEQGTPPPTPVKTLDEELKDLERDYRGFTSDTGAPALGTPNENTQEALEAEVAPETPRKEDPKKLITGYILLLVADIVLPKVICFLFKREKKPADIRLTAAEKKELGELADNAAMEIQLNISPLALFLIVLSVVYVSKT